MDLISVVAVFWLFWVGCVVIAVLSTGVWFGVRAVRGVFRSRRWERQLMEIVRLPEREPRRTRLR